MNTYSSVRGEMVVLDDLDLPEITLWRTYQADYCYLNPILGSVEAGERGSWYKVKENYDGDLMILADIRILETGEETLGWIDYRNVSITSPQAVSELSEGEESCQSLQP
jgi:hypothetical protein